MCTVDNRISEINSIDRYSLHNKTERLVNTNTGEVIELYEGDRLHIVRKNTAEYLKSLRESDKTMEQKMWEKGYVRFEPNEDFTKLFNKEFEAVARELDGNATSLLIMMIPYAGYGSNVLFKKNNRDKVRLNDIVCDISPFSSKTTYKALEELKDKNVIVECSDIDGNRQYVVNPYIYFKGLYINKTVMDLFGGYKKKYLEKKKVQK